MKSFSRCLALAYVLLAATLLTSCASLGMGRKPPQSATVQAVEDDYHQAQLQAAATQEALDGLVVAADPDLKQSFAYFTMNLDLMEQVGKRLITHADGMFYRGTFYFVESGKSLESCTFPRSGKTDDQRSIDLGDNFYVISGLGGEIKRSFRAFQFDIEQLQGHLKNDLTPNGIDTIEMFLRKAKVDGDSLQETLREAQTALERAKTTMPKG